MNKTEHLLVVLGEENSEVIKGISKALRFGLDHVWPEMNETNRRHIERELAEVVAVAELLGLKIRDEDKKAKVKKLERYMDLSRGLGTLDFSKNERKVEHCYVGHCNYLSDRTCICLCGMCKKAKKADR